MVESGKGKKTRPGCFCANDCLDSEEMYIHGGILSLLLVSVGCSGQHCAILGCTGLYWTGLFWNVVDYIGLYWAVLGCTRLYSAELGCCVLYPAVLT